MDKRTRQIHSRLLPKALSSKFHERSPHRQPAERFQARVKLYNNKVIIINIIFYEMYNFISDLRNIESVLIISFNKNKRNYLPCMIKIMLKLFSDKRFSGTIEWNLYNIFLK